MSREPIPRDLLSAPDLKLPTVLIDGPAWSSKRYTPKLDHIDARALAEIEKGGELNMDDYHFCNSVHCIAGWYIHLCGKQGYDLEREFGGTRAATMIYEASTGYGYLDRPSFSAWGGSGKYNDDGQEVDENGLTKEEYDAYHLELLRARAAADPLPAETE